MTVDAQQIALLSSLLDHALDLTEVDRAAWLASLGPDVAHLGPTLRRSCLRRMPRGAPAS